MNGPHAHVRSLPPAGAPASLRRLGRGWMRHWVTSITLVCFITTQTAAVAGPNEGSSPHLRPHW